MEMRPKFLLLISLIIAAVISAFYFVPKNGQKYNVSLPAPTPTENPTQMVRVDAPDGARTLVMKEKVEKENTVHTFFVSDGDGGTLKEIFKKSLPSDFTLAIPLNTFSPGGNKYVFVKETENGVSKYYILSSTDGLLLNNGEPVEISAMFLKNHPNLIITDVTGWAAPTLIIINTDKSDGGQGPSFWFDLSSKSFVQLANRFN